MFCFTFPEFAMEKNSVCDKVGSDQKNYCVNSAGLTLHIMHLGVFTILPVTSINKIEIQLYC